MADQKIVPVSVHDRNLRAMRCVVSDRWPVTLHHCHGGSMLKLMSVSPNPGMAQRSNPFFQIPLLAEYHVGQFGIDSGMGRYKGVKEWEKAFGEQATFLEEINGQLTYDLWKQAAQWEQCNRASA